MQEPDFYLDECDFQTKTLECIREANPALEFIVPFGLDAVFLVPGAYPLRFLEFKLFTGQRPLGVPFGRDRTQVQLLSVSADALANLDVITRWCFADMRLGPSTSRYAVLNASAAKKAAMGGVKFGKENNFNINRVMTAPLDWTAYLQSLTSFLSSHYGKATAAPG